MLIFHGEMLNNQMVSDNASENVVYHGVSPRRRSFNKETDV